MKRTNLPASGRGFTLIELLVVISIIGILATLIVNNLTDARARARDAKRKQDLNQLKTALRMYYNDHQAYPDDQTDIGDSGASFVDGETIYMKQLPTDEFTYAQIDNDSFTVHVTLENLSDPDLETSQSQCSITTEDPLYYVCQD